MRMDENSFPYFALNSNVKRLLQIRRCKIFPISTLWNILLRACWMKK